MRSSPTPDGAPAVAARTPRRCPGGAAAGRFHRDCRSFTGQRPGSFAGDFNGDGQADIGLRNKLTGVFYLRYGPGFTAQTSFPWDVG
jgi:hypothetical protein